MNAGNSTVIVLAHGWGCDKSIWNGVRSILEPGYETHVFDACGFGQREDAIETPEDWALDLAVEDLRARIGERPSRLLFIVGASMGGEVSLLAAARQLAPVAGLVAIGASPKHLKCDGYPFGIEGSAAEGLLALLRSGYADAIRSLAPGVFLTEEDPDVVERGLQFLSAVADRVRDPEKPIRILEKIYAKLDLRESLGKIAMPVLLLHGERDAVAPPQVGRFLAERISKASLEVIPGAGHLVHLTAPAKVAEAIARFVASSS